LPDFVALLDDTKEVAEWIAGELFAQHRFEWKTGTDDDVPAPEWLLDVRATLDRVLGEVLEHVSYDEAV
jgi:hypothetical protein